jgi:hypothetical protein
MAFTGSVRDALTAKGPQSKIPIDSSSTGRGKTIKDEQLQHRNVGFIPNHYLYYFFTFA